MDRDCNNCARCGKDGCTSWGCDYINREEAIKAWKAINALNEKYGKEKRDE